MLMTSGECEVGAQLPNQCTGSFVWVLYCSSGLQLQTLAWSKLLVLTIRSLNGWSLGNLLSSLVCYLFIWISVPPPLCPPHVHSRDEYSQAFFSGFCSCVLLWMQMEDKTGEAWERDYIFQRVGQTMQTMTLPAPLSGPLLLVLNQKY